MGYDLRITRSADESASEAAPVTLDEWRSYVASDAEMSLTGFAEVTNPMTGESIRVDDEGLAVWADYSGDDPGGNRAWFSYRDRGEIVVKSPDDEIIAKMRQIAQRLGARVVGEEGEEY